MTPAIVPARPGCCPNSTAAATYAAPPTRETGATTARSLAGGSTLAGMSEVTRYQVMFTRKPKRPSATASAATTSRTASFLTFRCIVSSVRGAAITQILGDGAGDGHHPFGGT